MALAASNAAADLRLSLEPDDASSAMLLIDAGAEHGGGRFEVALPPNVARRAGTSASVARGTLSASGRAAVRVETRGAELPFEYRVAVSSRAGGGPEIASLGPGVIVSMGPAGNQSEVSAASPVAITLPRAGARVGSPSIDVRGRLRGPFNQDGVQVTVNGQAADVFPSTTGAGRFLLANLELTNGTNSIVVEAVTAGGTRTRRDTSVNLVRATSNNVVVEGPRAYAARGTAGFAVMDLRTREYQTFGAPAGTERVDDLSVRDGLLFLLDAQNGGNLSVMSLADPDQPTLVSGPVGVPVGPFAGVSAGAGRVVVSGGTSLLTLRSYDPLGNLGASVSTIDLGIGQPDVLVSEDGTRAFVSTDFAGSVGGAGFGISTIALNAPPLSPTLLSRTGLPGAGFTGGSQGPANFPIESAVIQDQLLTAHGGGLARIGANGTLAGTTPLSFGAVNVDTLADRAVVVGTGRSLAEFDFSSPGSPTLISSISLPGPGAFSGVALQGTFVAIAAGNGGLRVLRR